VKIYCNDKDIEIMKNLRVAYEEKDHRDFLDILNNQTKLEKDDFTINLIPELKRVILQEFV